MSCGRQTRLWATAYHEAGHALAALREGRRVKEVCLSPSCPDSGLTVWSRGSDRRLFQASNPDGDLIPRWHETLQDRLAEIRISLAGPLAEAKLLNRPLRTLGAASDLSRCQGIAHSMTVQHRKLQEVIEIAAPDNSRLPPLNMLEVIDEQRRRTRRWVGRPQVWRTLAAIAEALANEQKLDEYGVVCAADESATRESGQMVLPLWSSSCS